MKQHPFLLILLFSTLYLFSSSQVQAQKDPKLEFGIYGGINFIELETQGDGIQDKSWNEGYTFGIQLRKNLILKKLDFEALFGLEQYKLNAASLQSSTITGMLNELSFQPIFSIPIGDKDNFINPLFIIGAKTNMRFNVNLKNTDDDEITAKDKSFSGTLVFGTGVVFPRGKKVIPKLQFRANYQMGSQAITTSGSSIDLGFTPWSFSLLGIFEFKR